MSGLDGIDPHWLWLAGGLLLATAEVIAPGFFLIWLALAALITGVAAWLVPMAAWAQVALFAELAIVEALIVRRWLRDHRHAEPIDPLLNDRTARLVGETVAVTQAITGGSGRVRLADGEWIARGADAAAGSQVRIVGSEGSALIVEPTATLPPAPTAGRDA